MAVLGRLIKQMPNNFPKKRINLPDGEPVISSAKRFGLLLFETVKVVLISMAIILPIRYFLVQPFIVEGASMEPTFASNEYLIIDEISYRFNEPERGEVVVFRYHRDPRQFFIKRIVGVPGDVLEVKDGTVLVNKENLVETYIDDANMYNSDVDSILLDDDEYFLLGDNRSNSLDSRVFGPVERKYIVGKVWFRTWPFDRFSFFTPPQY